MYFKAWPRKWTVAAFERRADEIIEACTSTKSA
jgi:hypothetical protein